MAADRVRLSYYKRAGSEITIDATAAVGPDLNQLAAAAEDRERGTSAEDYVREAIVDPPAFVVDGYSGDTMPGNYGDQLTPEEIDTLVEYLLGLSQTEEGEARRDDERGGWSSDRPRVGGAARVARGRPR